MSSSQQTERPRYFSMGKTCILGATRLQPSLICAHITTPIFDPECEFYTERESVLFRVRLLWWIDSRHMGVSKPQSAGSRTRIHKHCTLPFSVNQIPHYNTRPNKIEWANFSGGHWTHGSTVSPMHGSLSQKAIDLHVTYTEAKRKYCSSLRHSTAVFLQKAHGRSQHTERLLWFIYWKNALQQIVCLLQQLMCKEHKLCYMHKLCMKNYAT